jgi:3-hydroxybutyryl-CoA dehydratase
MSERLYFDELSVGESWKSHARTVTESDVSDFAGLTGDHDPLHMDHEYARNTPFGRPIAHGLLGLSFVAGLSSQSPPVHTVAFTGVRDWRFLHPLYFGDTVHVVTKVVEKSAKSRRRGTVLWRRQLINDRDQVIQEGEFETIVHVSPDSRDAKPQDGSSDRSASQKASA